MRRNDRFSPFPDGVPTAFSRRGWALATKAHTHDCADCRKQASVTAGTVMHGSKLVLTAWFWTAHLMATHSNGISALQLQKQLCLGSYKTAWLLATKVRRAMGAPRRMPLAGLVEVDESLIAPPPRTTRRAVAAGVAAKANYWSPTLLRSAKVGPTGSAWRNSRTSPPTACTPSWASTSPPAPSPGPAAGPATPTNPASYTIRTLGETWPPYRPALGSSRLRQPQDLFAGRLRRPPTPAPAIRPRRVRLPFQPGPPHPSRRLPLHPRHWPRNQAGNLQNLDSTGRTAMLLIICNPIKPT